MIFGRHIAVTIMQAVFISLLLVIPVSGQTIDNEAGITLLFSMCDVITTSSGNASNSQDSNTATETRINTPGIYQCDFDVPVAIKSYIITGDNNPDRAAKTWTFEYYDGSSWLVLDSVTNESSWAVFEPRSYKIDSPVVASSYRISMNSVQGTTPRWDIPEIRFSEYYISNVPYTGVFSTAGETIEFDIQAGGFQIVGKWLADIQVCIDDGSIMDCKTNQAWTATMNDNFRYSGIASYLLDYTRNHSVTITTSGYMEFDGINVIQQSTIYSSGGAPAPTATPNVTPTPAPYVYNEIDTPDGIVNTRFDYTATAGDTAIATALLFLFFSVWAMIIMWLFVVRRR